MGSLTGCLKKAGKAIDADDKRAILARSKELRGSGSSAQDAATAAVREQLEKVRALLVEAGDAATTAESDSTPSAPAAPVADTAPQSQPTDRLTDAGEELIRNRRGKLKGLAWDDVSAMNDTLKVAQVVKANVWPRPDYAKMVEDGAPAWKVAALKSVYDKLAAAPVTRAAPTDSDLRTYIETMQAVREALGAELDRVAALPDGAELWKSIKSENVFGKVFPLPADARAVYGRPSPFDRSSEQGKENNRRALLIGGNNVVQALQFGYKTLGKIKDLLADGFPAKQEAWQKSWEVRATETRDNDVPEAERTGQPQQRFYVYEKGSRWWRLAKGGQDGGYATREQAEAFARSLTQKKREQLPPSRGLDLADVRRTGPDWRSGRNVTAQDIMDHFGFRGVNLGEYVKAKQTIAQAHLNNVFDAMSDLADLLGVPPKAMSLNGTLGVAIGAQGSGKALAHFVPGVNEINITRDSGAGALAHEFGHALDHYFAAQHGKAVSMAKRPYLSAAIEGMSDPGGVRPEVIEAMRHVMRTINTRPMTEAEAKKYMADQRELNQRRLDRWIKEFKGNKGADPAALDAVAEKLKRGDVGAPQDGDLETNLAELVRAAGFKPGNITAASAISTAYRLRDLADESRFLNRHIPQQPTDYARASDAMDAKKQGDGYWSTPWEKFARAFETFAIDALHDRERESLYLTGLVDSEAWRGWAAETGKSIPYPAGEERLAMQQAFQKLVDTIETRETDAGTMLFSVDGQPRQGDTAVHGAVTPDDRRAVELLSASLAERVPGLRLDAVPARGGAPDGQPLQGDDRARVGAAELLRRLTGKRAVFYSSNIRLANGIFDLRQPNVLFVARDADKPHMAIIGHEFLHGLRRDRPDLYAALRDRVLQLTRDRQDHDILLQIKRTKMGMSKLSQDVLDEEFLADVMGDFWTDAEFWRLLAGEKPGNVLRQAFEAAARFINSVLDILKAKPFGSAVYLRDVRAARQAMADALRDYVAIESIGVDQTGDLMFSLAEDERPRLRPSSAPLDRALQIPGTLAARLTSPTYDWLLKTLDHGASEWIGRPYLYAKAGLAADYGLGPDYKQARSDMQTGIRKGTREAATVIEQLATLSRAESRIAHLWMQEKPDTATEQTLMAALPETSRETLRQLKDRIDQMGREAVNLGLLSAETYERNAMAYLHRSYRKYELEDPSQRAVRSRSVRILGDQFKGRGLRDDAGPAKIATPSWWTSRQEAGKADTSLKGEKFYRLEKRRLPDETTPDMFEGRDGRLGWLESVLYWPAAEPLPPHLADWRNDGLWEARFFDKAGKVGMWRDFSLEERTAMGEIQEVRYSAAKTMLQATRDLETARLLDWVARNQAVLTEDQIPEGAELVKATEWLTRPYLDTEWVQVPDAAIPGTAGVRRYGNLAGRFVPGPIWNDLRQVVSLSDQGDLMQAWEKLLRAWKISKTALSPATHTNNVLSNFILADAHDIQARHIARAARAWLYHKDRPALRVKADPEAAKLVEDYQDNGGDGGKFNEGELREDVMQELLDQLEADINEQDSATALLSAAQVLDLIRAKEFRQAFAAIGATKTAGQAMAPAKALVKLYGREDELFRLAAFIKARDDGLSDHDAGLFARTSFLDYNINAPWIAALRKSMFPFVAFTYRAVPMLLRIAAERPHKMAKYALVAGALNALAYGMLGGGGDEDKERALMPDEKAGHIWGIFPKLVRMPWNDENGSPVFLDVRRWVPAGDVIDTNANHAAVPVPAPLVPGGPLVILFEIILNRQGFTGKEITKETDTLAEKWGKFADYLWKSAAPNMPGVPGTYSTESIMGAASGKTDVFGREQNIGQAALSAVGVKIASYPEDVAKRNMGIEARSQILEIRRGLRNDARQLARKGITQEEYEDRVRAAQAKIEEIVRKLNEKLGASKAQPATAEP